MAPTEQGVRTSPTRLEMLLVRAGSSPRVMTAFTFAGQKYRQPGCGLLNLSCSCPWWLFHAAFALGVWVLQCKQWFVMAGTVLHCVV